MGPSDWTEETLKRHEAMGPSDWTEQTLKRHEAASVRGRASSPGQLAELAEARKPAAGAAA